MPTKEKEEAISALVQDFSGSTAIYVTHYSGLSVAEITDLRKQLRETGAVHRVAKNTLAIRAAKQAGIEGLESHLSGPTAITISKGDIVASAKVLVTFSKAHPHMVILGGVVEGKPATSKDVSVIATLPSKEELVSQLLGTLNSPVTGLARVLNGPTTSLVRVLGAIAEKKAAAGV